jgi:hypothetical protein
MWRLRHYRSALANWISGGEIYMWKQNSNDGWRLAIRRQDALQIIAAQEKPTSNATVRRMARMAREALK